MKKQLMSIVVIMLILIILLPLNVMAATAVLLDDIQDKTPGENVVISGTTTFNEVTVKVLRPNDTVLYINVLTNTPFKDIFTLPKDATEGTYTVIVGEGSIIDTKTFKVKKAALDIPVTGVKLNKNKLELVEGETEQLLATVSPVNATNKGIIWSTSDKNIAKVSSSGLVTAVSVGSCNIKVTTKDGNKTATCEVEIIKESIEGGGSSRRRRRSTKIDEPEQLREETTPEPKPISTPVKRTFNDIADYPWAKKEIETLASLGIIRGTSETTFDPGKNITRADFITLLIRTLDLRADIDSNFDDVHQGIYYYEPLGIAKKLGIAQGVGNNKFNPRAQISRQDMMLMVARALKITNKISITGSFDDISTFGDASQVASYAVEGVANLVKQGIIQGSNNRINPLVSTTRAETAVTVYKIYNMVNP